MVHIYRFGDTSRTFWRKLNQRLRFGKGIAFQTPGKTMSALKRGAQGTGARLSAAAVPMFNFMLRHQVGAPLSNAALPVPVSVLLHLTDAPPLAAALSAIGPFL
jgi:hypothetical protein